MSINHQMVPPQRKIRLRHKYFRYLHQTNTLVITIISAIEGTKFHISSINITKVNSFDYVIYFSCLHC